MKKVMIKYTIEIPEDRLDKYCNINRLGRNEATVEFKGLAEVHGRTAVFEEIDETITIDKENRHA
jgi:hypothetical protein